MVVVFWQGFGGLGLLPLVVFPLIAFVPPAVARTGTGHSRSRSLITGIVGPVFCVMVDRRLAPGRTRMTVDRRPGRRSSTAGKTRSSSSR